MAFLVGPFKNVYAFLVLTNGYFHGLDLVLVPPKQCFRFKLHGLEPKPSHV